MKTWEISVNGLIITIKERGADYIAYWNARPGKWEAGATPEAALWKLLESYEIV